jgi:hypothetical protein
LEPAGARTEITRSLPTEEIRIGEAPESVQRLLTSLVIEAIPHEYEDTSKWGMKKEVFGGIKLRREGWRIETQRRRRKVNHGTWRRYHIRLVDPDKNLTVRVLNVADLGDGRLGCHVVVRARLDATARIAEWNRGIQLISLSTRGEADVRLRMTCAIGLTIDPSRLPPDVILSPEVTAADVSLRALRIRHISKARGPLAREAGDALRAILAGKIDEKEPKLVERINRQIAKHKNELRFSTSDQIHDKWK